MNRTLNTVAILIALCFSGCKFESVGSGSEDDSTATVSRATQTKIIDQIVEASCGQCQFGMKGTGCDLAVRIDGKSYYVDGSSIDDHGDAHANDGLCNCIRRAKVSGQIVEGRFVATYFDIKSPITSETE